jgi:Na+/H+ antiporter NhaA
MANAEHEPSRPGPEGSAETEAGGTGRTTWLDRDTALRRFLRAETGSGAVLFAAAVIAIIWANISYSSYEHVWTTLLTVQIGHVAISLSLREWINAGLMTFFFVVVGLEARREFDIGEFRERPRVVLPVMAGLGGMIGAIALYLVFNAGKPSAHGWGASMSTDTAFALGVLALLGKRVPDRLRGFILTVTVVDDIVGLVVIATVYTRHLTVVPLIVAIGAFGVVVLAAWRHVRFALLYLVLFAVSWVALVKSGVDPIVIGIGAGLIAYAAPASRADLERATDLFRGFREQPTPDLARAASDAVRTALSPNDRLQQVLHPWTSYVIVPLFGLANAGIPIDLSFLSHAYTSSVTLGIVAGYVVGKPVGVTSTSVLLTKLSRGRLRPPVGWVAVVGGGTIAGTGFTVSLLVASVAFSGARLKEATLGVLTAAVISAALTWAIFFAAGRLPPAKRAAALLGRSEVIVDLADPVDPERDHVRGPADAAITLLEYADFECPYCGQAEPVIRELLSDFGDLRYVWRHLPLADVHPRARMAAEAAEAAAAQGAFWPMHDLLVSHQSELDLRHLLGYAEAAGLDVERFREDLRTHRWSDRVEADVESADLSGVAGTPTFFINGQRQPGAYDIDSLGRAVRAAHDRAQALTAGVRP